MRQMLTKWRDRVQRLAGGRQLPVNEELILVLSRPLDGQTQSSRRQSSTVRFSPYLRLT